MAALVVCALCLGTSVALGTATLRGQITDESTNAPLSSASVIVELQEPGTSPLGAGTNPEGEYELAGLPPGRYRVTFSHIGYATKSEEAVVLTEAGAATLDAALVAKDICMEALVVSSSRRPEKYVETPASAVIVSSEDVQATASFSVTDHLEVLPGVDASSTGLSSSNVVVRGFNNVLSTTLLSLVDYRIARIPSLRVNAYQFLTTVDEDIDRVEVVLGPGSALYGPNASDGIMHVITKSPLASKGGGFSLAGGQRDLLKASFRYAGTSGKRWGCRVSGQYYQAHDWEYHDPNEEDTVTLFRQGPDGNQYEAAPIDNRRDFDIEKLSGDLRLDRMLGSDGLLVVAGGLSQASNIELSDLGAAQMRDWRYGYGQIRFSYKNFFAQTYANLTHSGDTYLRRSGALIIDHSRLYVGQVQHGLELMRRLRLTYGLDALLTRPETEGTLHGGNEDRDDIDAFGIFTQADLGLSPRLKVVVAARLDRDNVIDHPVISPRVGVIYRAAEHQSFRATFNSAFNTPSSADLFLDILADTEPMPPQLEPALGPTFLNVRGRGSVDGFHFRYGSDARAQMVSLYGGLLASGGLISDPESYLAPDANSVWPALKDIAVGLDSSLGLILPDSLGAQSPGVFARLDPDQGSFVPVPASAIQDVAPLEETTTSTLEFGYKGRIGWRLNTSADVYYTRKNNFVGPLQNETPHVLLDSSSFVSTLTEDIIASTGDTALAEATANGLYDQFKDIPIGLASPTEVQNATDVILTRRNFGLVDVVGVDLAAVLHISPNWGASGFYSYISEDLFPDLDGIADVATNTPRHKFGGALQFRTSNRTVQAQTLFRWVDGFPVLSGVYEGQVERYLEINLNVAYRLMPNAEVSLTVQNVLDNAHAEFVGSPELGRLAILRLKGWF